MSKIKVFTTFSGYDSQCLALDRLKETLPDFDYDLVGWSEIAPEAVTAHNLLFPQWSDRNYGDITKIDWEKVPDFDLLTYSSPCQDWSIAGQMRGGQSATQYNMQKRKERIRFRVTQDGHMRGYQCAGRMKNAGVQEWYLTPPRMRCAQYDARPCSESYNNKIYERQSTQGAAFRTVAPRTARCGLRHTQAHAARVLPIDGCGRQGHRPTDSPYLCDKERQGQAPGVGQCALPTCG